MSFTNCKIEGDGVSYETYSKQPDGAVRGSKNYIMSRGELTEFALCPEKWLKIPIEDNSTTATNWGSLIDTLLTGPEAFDLKFIVCPETYTSTKGEEKPWTNKSSTCRKWNDEQKNQGLTVITQKVYDNALLAVKTVSEHPAFVELLKVSRKQVYITGFWKDKATGLDIPVRVLLDLVPPADHPTLGKWLCDLKTARNGDPEKWGRVVDDCAYDTQAALYLDMYISATGRKEDRNTWVWAVQENTPPFHIVEPMPAASSEFLAWGRAKYQHALAYYAQCLKTGVWPSYQPFGSVMFGLQIIGPESLYRYKQMAGLGNRQALPEAPEPEQTEEENVDVAP